MKKGRKMNGMQHQGTIWQSTPVSLVFEAETSGFYHHNAVAAYPAEIVPIRRESRIMKFLKSL